ncbi:MAG: Yip1-domain-containing protein [Benniella sp.]|nr:MAG: Yip1-domain-containing protein [Benniella sp.]
MSAIFQNSGHSDHSGQNPDYLQFYQTQYSDPSGGGAYGGSYHSQQRSTGGYSTNMSPTPDLNYGDYNQGIHGTQMNPQPTNWLAAFGSGGLEGEPPLLEELGINFSHIKTKSFTVLNPLRPVDPNIMDDTDLAGPLVFCLAFGTFLLLSGKQHFGYVYGVAVVGCSALYIILNLMSPQGVDIPKTASVLGYCMLPLVILSSLSTLFVLNVGLGYILSVLAIAWCTYSSSGFFTAVLGMNDQRFLVAYPVGLFYGCFALMIVF